MKSKTKIERKLRRKRNPLLARSIVAMKKKIKWNVVAHLVSLPRRNKIEKNLDEINKAVKEGDTVVVPGKVLGRGSVDKKIRVCAFSFSKEAISKLKEKKCEIVSLDEEIKANPDYRGITLLK